MGLINLDYRTLACGRLSLGHGFSSFRFLYCVVLYNTRLEVAMALKCAKDILRYLRTVFALSIIGSE